MIFIGECHHYRLSSDKCPLLISILSPHLIFLFLIFFSHFIFQKTESVYKYPNDDRKFYAVFSTSTTNGLIGSAICTFSLNKIEEVFLGKFKEQSTSSSAWLPVLSSKVPEPRPGTCVNDTQVLPDSVLNFIRGHPLMDSAVEHDNGRPIFYKRDLIFTRIVIDRLEVDGLQYTVYFAATNTGLVYKIIEWYDQSGQVHTNLVDIIEATNGEPIRAIEISSRHKSLYVASDSGIKQIDLFWCKNHYESCTRCIQDPYCGWDPDQNECKPYTIGLVSFSQNLTLSSSLFILVTPLQYIFILFYFTIIHFNKMQ